MGLEQILTKAYESGLALQVGGPDAIPDGLSEEDIVLLDIIGKHARDHRAVLAVVITSLAYKVFKPEQDIRCHQRKIKGGYSGRSIDTKHVTPFLRANDFPFMAAGSGWLTRSLEQPLPYNMDYPARIQNEEIRNSFLQILNNVQVLGSNPFSCLAYLFKLLIFIRDSERIELPRPSGLTINTVLNYLSKHFEYDYRKHLSGTPRIPVLAIYSFYQCALREVERYHGKLLLPLESHTASDERSGNIGDINIKDSGAEFFEAVEVKHEIPIDLEMVVTAYRKFRTSHVNRYYILSTADVNDSERERIDIEIARIKDSHGCQVIVNGIMPSLKYYLRVLNNVDAFVDAYVKNLINDPIIAYEHKDVWNRIVEGDV